MNETSGDRLAAFGTQLIETHDLIRAELARLRSGERPTRDLRAHCLTFCAVLTGHHSAEDTGAFPAIAARHPELRPVLDELGRDHEIVTDALRTLTELLDSDAPEHDVRNELDTLNVLVETHLTYEERKLVSILDAMPRTDSMTEVFRAVTVAEDAFSEHR